MRYRTFLAVGFVLVALALVSCNLSSTTLPVLHLRAYTSTQGINPGSTSFFLLPLSSTSTPVGSLAGAGGPTGMCIDTSGRLFVPNEGGTKVDVFNQPIQSGATPAFSLPAALSPGCASDVAGNLYVVDTGGNAIRVFHTPVQMGSTVGSSITSGVSSPFGVATDASGDVFVANSANITEYSPLGSGNALLATFGSIVTNWGLTIGPDGNLYVSNGSSNGSVDVYLPSAFKNSGTKDHTITLPPNGTTVIQIAFDPFRNMYVNTETTTAAQLLVLPPPYTAVTVTVPLSDQGGIVIAP